MSFEAQEAWRAFAFHSISCIRTNRAASTIRGTRESRGAGVIIRIASDYWVADTFDADVSRRALFISTGGIANAAVAYKSVRAFTILSLSSVWICGTKRTADTADALHTRWTILCDITLQHRDTLTGDTVVIVWAIGIISTDWEAMSKEAGKSIRTSFVVWILTWVANWTADSINAVHTIRTSSWVTLGIATDFREADATDTLVSRRAIASIYTDRIAMSKEALSTFWA